jgi:hypothetical protein
MQVLAVASFVGCLLAQEIAWRRVVPFRRYQGESAQRRSRYLTHLSAEHYRPDVGTRLTALRVSTFAMVAMFPIAAYFVVR